MRWFVGRRMLKYIGFPAAVSAGLVWKGSTHQKASTSWPTEDILLNVQVFHRHAPVTLLRNERIKENTLWTDEISKKYGLLQYKDEKFSAKNGIDLNDMFKWKHIINKLDGSYIMHKSDNYDLSLSECIINSKNMNVKTQNKLSEINTWDIGYSTKRNLAFWSGKLTDNGVCNLNELGTWLRQRYVEKFAFLSPTFDESSSKIYTISTNFARTIESADALLNGLYPPNNRSKNDCSIPIYTDYRVTWLYPNPSCARWKRKRVENEQKLKKMDENEHQQMIAIKEKLCKYYDRSGDEVKWLHLCEALNCRLHHEIDLPPEDIVSKDEMRQFINYVSLRVCKSVGMDRDTLRLSSGVLLKILCDNMKDLDNKFVIYSGHDGTIQQLLVALANGKDFDFPWPKYAANLIFEVWERNIKEQGEDKDTLVMDFKDWMKGIDRTRGKYVRILYDGHVIHLNGNEFTPIESLREMWNDLLIDKETYWKRDCICD